MAAAIGNKRILSTLRKYWGHSLCRYCQPTDGYYGDNVMVKAVYFGKNLSISYPISYMVEYIEDYIDFNPIKEEVRDMLVTEIESNPELIYSLLMQSKETYLPKNILEILTDSIITKFATNKKSDLIVKEITVNKKKGDAILIIPQEILTEDNIEKIQDTIDRVINHVCQKVDCNINREVSFEDDTLTITIDISK